MLFFSHFLLSFTFDCPRSSKSDLRVDRRKRCFCPLQPPAASYIPSTVFSAFRVDTPFLTCLTGELLQLSGIITADWPCHAVIATCRGHLPHPVGVVHGSEHDLGLGILGILNPRRSVSSIPVTSDLKLFVFFLFGPKIAIPRRNRLVAIEPRPQHTAHRATASHDTLARIGREGNDRM